MLAAKDLRLAQETVHDLRAQGQEERARALEAVLAAAVSAQAGRSPESPSPYLTTGQAARALGVSLQTIKNWVAAGRLAGVRLGGRVLVPREALRQYLDELRKARPEVQETSAADRQAAAARRAFVLGGLPAAQLARLEALHTMLEVGQRLSRTERAELVALERALTEAAGQRLEDWGQRSGARER
jgi:excisionase family DNA binding protein